MSELLPCPFCGGEAEEYAIAGCGMIRCGNCGASIGGTFTKDATEAWNTRTGYFCQFSRPDHDEACVLMGELKKAKLDGIDGNSN